MDLGRVDVVLVRATRPANVGAACRALKNMGLRSLVLVGGAEGLDQPEVRALAHGAWDVLDGAARRATLREAVAPATLVAGTSGRRHPEAWAPRRLAVEADARTAGGRLALVFGPESSGLSDDELALCHVRVHVPADPAHPSLNLAQAVLLVAYELRLAALAGNPAAADSARAAARATAGEVEGALDDLRRGLLGIGYLNPANPEAILSELRALITRAGPTAREVALLRGLARQVAWAASRIAPPPGGTDNPGSTPGEEGR
ncbi:MAG TPA: TrmH family RNA methyltransferase [Vicinamibacteria bacterium]|nr:TrmH family RNA methyltransferase [Vicinamibacteria bacterium]